MARTQRFAKALSAVAVIAIAGGCAGSGAKAPQVSGGFAKGDSNILLALRAQQALEGRDFGTAIALSERAVEKAPNDAGYRALLGNAYFAAGRFASAEAAYKDSLSLISNQPQVILKLVLVTIAQGKKSEALAFLAAGQEVLDPADYGLALALAGDPYQAVSVLEASARAVTSDPRVRQNLALAHAIAGNWEGARTVAAQDLPANLVDQRVQEWIKFANPARVSDQVAALTGVTPVADPGQPVRLALRGNGNIRMAAAVPVAPPQPQPQLPAHAAVAEPAPEAYYAPAEPLAALPVAEISPPPMPVAEYVPPVAEAAPVAKAKPILRAASFVPKAKRPTAAPRAQGNSNSVVQLGAYGSRERVSVAWDQITKRYPGLKAYSPVIARFNGPRGTVYRLAVKGFANQQEAQARCRTLQGKGGSCFVRSVAGDSPIRMASR